MTIKGRERELIQNYRIRKYKIKYSPKIAKKPKRFYDEGVIKIKR